MKWVRFRVRTTPEAEDVIVSEMSEIGMCGAQIEDNVPLTASEKERIFTFDADNPNNQDIAEGEAYVSFYAELDKYGTIKVVLSPEDEYFSLSDFLIENNDSDENPEDVEEIESIEVHMTPDEQLMRMEEKLSEIRQYMEIGAGTVTVSQMDDAAWKDKWKEYFHSFMIDDILVTPSWEAEPAEKNEARYILHIDPGTAFGTGAHETTQLAIRSIRKLIEAIKQKNQCNNNVKNQDYQVKCTGKNIEGYQNEEKKILNNAEYAKASIRMLDIGTGSGILSIMALMFGADACVGTDLDPFTEEAVRENLETNHIDKERFKLILGNIIDDENVRRQVLEESLSDKGEIHSTKSVRHDDASAGVSSNMSCESDKAGYDIVVANILPVVLVPLTPTVPPFIKPGGYYVTSGILNEKKGMMENIIKEAGLEIVETASQGEWCSITAKKPR